MDPSVSTDALLQRLLSAASLRARIISANIANQNTPGYLRREVRFEDLLREQLSSGDTLEEVEPDVVEDIQSPGRPDGNNVNLELELNALRENRLLYETYAAIVEGRGNIKKAALGRN